MKKLTLAKKTWLASSPWASAAALVALVHIGKFRLFNMLKQLASREHGSAMVLLALAMTVLIGAVALVTDFGLVALNKSRLANAADAAALAGVQELPEYPLEALAVARSFGQQNGITDEQMQIKLVQDLATSRYVGVEVTATKTVNYIMAKVLGYTTVDVQAKAAAQVIPVTSAYGAVPLFIPDTQQLIFGQQYTLRSKDADFGPGNFGALDFGSGANDFEKTLAQGYQGVIKVSYEIDTLTGVKKNKTIWGIEERIRGCTHGCTYDHFQPDCPRVMILPVVHYDKLNGHKPVTVVGFAAFLVDNVREADSIEITGHFVRTLTQGEGSLEQVDYGLRTVKLVE
ncbi:Protein of unknown function DUF2134, membrane [Desulfotomaculum nigrificans CO-1-SRB]|uniref:Putative Flp pilus-assembly TadG-like N-terminal domain-containing protein n=1 Tax=Desulfotomaculum nigrificans (strain DSM 14880 / VKM B-2319 / CO-1-SRB) TaxID=868595 RepID=F6B3M1_DESCC|nr:pilus assembly protein TadG-related protein [Desulfotomaculum nigrificans]AEF94050.1 Protein of unknown function DUF2134, membrane [Desulfotomaculum nigrificans CO-1-SRB]